ncbi:MAG: 7,8-didemethyl-8-hydroxy-5-deazariboflavin synthase CofG [Deltaproteobacteria bacterium]|nr:7,8-didemethyl-8-hydroxy-5-deazariboflavin synthase CofG [Deltaproteobacteria bacterium]MBW2209616.1 7,8-didemethyl-8-hydroxy-5-deazariboflavin synthase CofG [Deltaproteobacteria bacterium]MBW2213248.1 7,8-didemethyl-8-hydroxy-5-deazariboflavin synthase CofG [Deltaproteobacteria bacterium]MBW2550651.1 7,8-didemethyl-8-hydroxy-5-deazariboflavin synthase CofG [Deltaproteobacteria bacterium]MBW2627805.1 7,8-didemethyl-8-hydroxy-5-deazariboflavin synthase CofG [Deltaproteobacteria bacterium]
MSSRPPILEHASREPVSDEGAYRLSGLATGALCEAARTRRDRVWGKTLTFSPKVFLPITNLCRNQCDYCSFRRSPGDPGEWTMSPGEIRAWLQRARVQGCIEALFCLGDTPETGFRDYRTLLRSWGHERTVDYLRWAAEEALAAGLLPHTNAGILSRADMIALRPVNVSLGLMLENVSDRLCEKGMPHHRAPDKRPAKRMQMTREAGELRIPFTSGLLIGIGETVEERVDTILTIRRLHREYGHIGEVIVQNFRSHPDTPMGFATEPTPDDLAATIALARLILDDDVSVQAPPNLNPASTAALIQSGINDFGGISPVSPDYINPQHPWPYLDRLREACDAEGFRLEARLPVYPSHLDAPGFVDASLRPRIDQLQTELATP